MSRLDSFIRRLMAQRKCIDMAAEMTSSLPGPVLELGLGNGRTYDHLRERMPDRDIYVFERTVAAHPDCIPPEDKLFLGDARATLVDARSRLNASAALAHCDIGTGDRAATQALALEISPLLQALLSPGAVVISDQEMTFASVARLRLPDGVSEGRYYIYQLAPAQAAMA
jgi:hypothetical protein